LVASAEARSGARPEDEVDVAGNRSGRLDERVDLDRVDATDTLGEA